MKLPGFISKSVAKSYIARMSDIDVSDKDEDYMTMQERATGKSAYNARLRSVTEHAAHDSGMPSLVKHMAAIDKNGQRDRFISDCIDQIRAHQATDSKPFDEELVRLGLEACYDKDIARVNDRANGDRNRATDDDLINDVRVGVRAVYPRTLNGSNTQFSQNEFDYSIRLLEDKGALVKYNQEHGGQLLDDYGAPYKFLHTFEDGTSVPYTVYGHEIDNNGLHEERAPTLVYGTVKNGFVVSERVPLDTSGIREKHSQDGFAIDAISEKIRSGECTPPIVSGVPVKSRELPEQPHISGGRGSEFDDIMCPDPDGPIF